MAKDILLNDDFDIYAKDGDLAVGDSEDQEVWLLLDSIKGEWKFNALTGADLIFLQKGPFYKLELQKQIQESLRQDGFADIQIQFKGDSFTVKAFRKNG